MVVSWAQLLTNDVIIALVGHEAFARAMVAARSGHVHDVQFDPATLTITGRVRGTYRDDYQVSVYFARSSVGAISVHRSQCSCPVATDCKHAGAVLVVARHLAAAVGLEERPQWERTVERLLDSVQPGEVRAAPLAVEFDVERVPPFRSYQGRQDLRIRPVRRGRTGGWVRTGISWDDLDFVSRSYRAEHRELLLQLRAAAGVTRFSAPRTAWLSLSTVSGGLWGLLDQATEAGLELTLAKPLTGLLIAENRARIELDLRRVAPGVELAPRIILGERDLAAETLGVIGDPVHGLFVVDGPESAPSLQLIRLDHPLPREVRQLVVDSATIAVPVADEARFLADYLPQLRQRIAIASRDGSVTIPEHVVPRLALTVAHRPGPAIRLDWSVEYDLGGGTTPEQVRRYPLSSPRELLGVRDLDAEDRLLGALPLPYDALPELAASHTVALPAPSVTLTGLRAVTFVRHVLPGLAEAGVRIAEQGESPDFREASGPPAITAHVTPQDRSGDWFDLRFTVAIDGEPVPFEPLFVALAAGEDSLILETGVYFSLDRPEFNRLRELIEESRALQDRPQDGLEVSRFHTSVWEDLADLGAQIEQSSSWGRRVRTLDPARLAAGAPADLLPPPELRAELRPYQLDGFRWLAFLEGHELGGVLADDMGLGKTLQALALITHSRALRPAAPPFLVVAPTSVVSNWATEAARFAPHLRVVTRTSSAARRGADRSDGLDADIVLTSYAILRIDVDEFAEREWSGLILDEAQFVKNHRSKTHAAARRIVAPFRLAVTGTPLENSLTDLWAILSLTAPGLFPHLDRFTAFYRRPIERDGDAERLGLLQRRIKPLMLRRTKQAVLADLPAKQEQVVEIELHPRHQRIYQTHLQRERQRVLGLIDDLERNRFTVLRSLTLLRRLSLDPALIDEAHEAVPAAKLDVLLEHLVELAGEGHKALVFSQFTSLLARVRTRLEQAGLEYAYLDGSTRGRERVVSRFRDGSVPVFLISLKAGGFGLNLTEADYCFVLDPWWNPATEAQAVDRAHRIGQQRTVMVYRLVARDTIEQKVMALKARKEQLFGSVIGADALADVAWSAEELRDMLDAS